jgi:hypothetical protein
MSVVTHLFKSGDQARFNYPECFTTLPDYTEHRDKKVEIVRKLENGVEYDYEGDPMVHIRADDGWEGDAFESELEAP